MMAEPDVPILCTLSPNAIVDRLTEFEALFAESLTTVEREPLRLRLTFDADAETENRLRDVFEAERQCCAFLRFAFDRTEAGLRVEVIAPEDAAPTLDGMQALAERNAPPEVVATGWTR
ncbi:hypothetical protein [Actinomadura roseirufa]|uniref:hypothetical protein n=1 Tax=Actinomadura roseirufa TaxID=2094049 RepID=UPI00104142CE|nr:hypothetical protein [Actinomadura roseirufa]